MSVPAISGPATAPDPSMGAHALCQKTIGEERRLAGTYVLNAGIGRLDKPIWYHDRVNY